MINIFVTFAQDIKEHFSKIKGLPPINRVFAYLLFLIASILFIASVVVCALMAWGAIESLLNGDILDNDPAEEWDIR